MSSYGVCAGREDLRLKADFALKGFYSSRVDRFQFHFH